MAKFSFIKEKPLRVKLWLFFTEFFTGNVFVVQAPRMPNFKKLEGKRGLMMDKPSGL